MVPLLLSVKARSLQTWMRGLLQQTQTVEWERMTDPTALKYTQVILHMFLYFLPYG